MAHTFNLNTQESEAGRSVTLRPTGSTDGVPKSENSQSCLPAAVCRGHKLLGFTYYCWCNPKGRCLGNPESLLPKLGYCLYVFFSFFQDRVSLSSVGWPGTQRSTCLCLLSVEIKSEQHHCLTYFLYFKSLFPPFKKMLQF